MLKRYLWMIVILFLLGCTAELAEPVAQSTPLPAATATLTPAATMMATTVATTTTTVTVLPTASFHNDLTQTASPGPLPTQTRTPFMNSFTNGEKVAPPAGLIYVGPDSQHYLVDENGISQPVGSPEAILSPDLRYEEDGLTIIELASGMPIALASGNGFLFDWWPQNPDWVILAMFAEESWGCYFICGSPVLARIDGSEQILLADEISLEQQLTGPIASSPDGQQLAYTVGEQIFIFDFGSGISQINKADLGLPAEAIVSHPSFAPAGDLIAWAAYKPEAAGQYGVNSGVLITTATGELVNFIQGYQMTGFDGGFYPPAWSADGEWIAFQAISDAESLFGTFQAQPMSSKAASSSTGYAPQYINNWLLVQDFDRSPFAYVALGPEGNSQGTTVDLMQIERSMPFPLEDARQGVFYLPDSEGIIWQFDQMSLMATMVDLPSGSRLIGWLR